MAICGKGENGSCVRIHECLCGYEIDQTNRYVKNSYYDWFPIFPPSHYREPMERFPETVNNITDYVYPIEEYVQFQSEVNHD